MHHPCNGADYLRITSVTKKRLESLKVHYLQSTYLTYSVNIYTTIEGVL